MLAISFAWGCASWAFCCFQTIRTPSSLVMYSVLGFLPLSHPDGMLSLQNLLWMLLTFTHLPQWHQWLIMRSLRVGHSWVTSLSLFTFMYWRRKWQPSPIFLPGDPRDGGAWWAAIYGVAQSRTRQKRRSSSSSSDWVCQFFLFLSKSLQFQQKCWWISFLFFSLSFAYS